MNREQLAEEAIREYSEIRSCEGYAGKALELSYGYKLRMSLARDPQDSPSDIRSKISLFDRNVDTTSARLALASSRAQRFYVENHADLYEMALAEMEAEGIKANL